MASQPMPDWYDENRTVAEMAQISGKSKDTILGYLSRHKLKYKRVVDVMPAIPEWYNPNSTIQEMADKSGKSYAAIAGALRTRNLKCVSVNTTIKMKVPEWYDSNLSVSEMAKRANKSMASISIFLKRSNLPYKRKAIINKKPSKKKYSMDDFMQYYNENLTVKEISILSKIPERSVRSFLNRGHLKYFKIIREQYVGEWYSPNKTVEEMSFESGISYRTLHQLLYRRNLPFTNKRLNTVVTTL